MTEQLNWTRSYKVCILVQMELNWKWKNVFLNNPLSQNITTEMIKYVQIGTDMETKIEMQLETLIER